MDILITGASRGIGLEITRILVERGDQVTALCRRVTPELQKLKIKIIEADVASPEVEDILQKQVGGKLDCLINNAGLGEEFSTSLKNVDIEKIRAMFEINSIGPLRITRALLPRLKEAERPKVAHLSSLMGSISDNHSGQGYGYRMSKAALNAMNKSLSIDEPNLITVVLHPGWVQTDMGGPQAPLKPADSAQKLVEVIDQLKSSQSGRFFDYRGRELPW